MSPKFIMISLGLVLLLVLGITAGILITKNARSNEVKLGLEARLEEKEKEKQYWKHYADSVDVVACELVQRGIRQQAYGDSVVAQLKTFGERLVLIREYENDSIIGSFNLSEHLRVFTEWISVAQDTNHN